MCQVRAAIVAMFRRAKFYNKIFTPIGEDQVTNNINTIQRTCNTHRHIMTHDTSQVRFTQLAISGYQQILDYAASHPHHARQLEAEVIL